LMRRVFAWDVLHCDRCGGRRRLIATIAEGEIATKILAHLKLPVTAEGFLPIRAPPWEGQALCARILGAMKQRVRQLCGARTRRTTKP
jgi:hypothetical protein